VICGHYLALYLFPPTSSLLFSQKYKQNYTAFNWTHTELLGQAQTKHAREFKEAWHSMDNNTINRHVDIPMIYLQLKKTPNASTNNKAKNMWVSGFFL
jgi:hypothetical protein